MYNMEFLITALADVAEEADKRNLELASEELTSLVAMLSKFNEIKKEAYIKNVQVDGKDKFEVKSPKNPNWSGGTYNTKEEAKDRLKEVEMLKHMK